MNECQKRGHRKLFITCEECWSVVNEVTFKDPYEWISVKQQPVSKEYPVLIWQVDHDFATSVCWDEEGTYGEPGFFEENKEHYVKAEDITHWMPLPSSPKEE